MLRALGSRVGSFRVRLQRWLAWWIVVQLLLMPQIAHAQSLPQGAAQVVDQGGEPRDRLHLTLTATVVGPQAVALELVATPHLDAPAVDIRWEVDGLLLSGGPAEERTAAVAAQTDVSSHRGVALPGPGIYPIGVMATYAAGPETQYGASGMVFAIVDAAGQVQVTDRDPRAPHPAPGRTA